MKTSFSKAILFLAIGIISLTSCKQEDPAKEATISLKVTSATSESIAFEITTENAKTFSYAVGKTSEISAAEYKTQDADNGNPVKLETTGLQANTEYTIKAFATNTEGRNTNEVAQTATTSESASIRIEILEKTSHSVKFKLTPLNAIRYAYTIVETSSEIETVPLDKIIDQDSESEFEETGLKENTNYSIIAAATNAEGEESERTYMSVLTEIEPVITVSEIQPSFNQALVSIYSDNASGYGYAAVEKGKEMPQRSSFKTGTITDGSASFIIQSLAPQTDYTLYIYGINAKGYEGEISAEEFSTMEEPEEKAFDVQIENLCSTDADIVVTMDNEKYSKFYFVLSSRESLYPSDYNQWDWQNIVHEAGYCYPAYREYHESTTIGLREWIGADEYFYPESTYIIGAIPENADGSLDATATIWKEFEMPEVEFGESTATVSIEEISSSYDKIAYAVNSDSQGIECYYTYYMEGSYSDGQLDQYAMTALQSIPYESTGETLIQDYLRAGMEYTVIAVPKDSEGKLGAIAYLNTSTKSIDYTGNAEGEASVLETGMNEVRFDCVLGNNAVAMKYHYVKASDYEEQSFLRGLLVNNAKEISSSQEVLIGNLDPGVEYVFGFAPIDENGISGTQTILRHSTTSYVFDGNPLADVEIEITSCMDLGGGMYWPILNATPNEYVSKYHIGFKDSYSSDMSSSEFVDQCAKGKWFSYTAAQTEISDLFTDGGNVVILVLMYDLEGKMCPIKEVRVEETWN